jgi:hypothetical protein
MNDLKFAVRQLVETPGFSVTEVLEVVVNRAANQLKLFARLLCSSN